MPDTPSNDDQFADLFSRLPTASRPQGPLGTGPASANAASAATGDAAERSTSGGMPEAPGPADAAPTPGTRRAARAAASRDAPHEAHVPVIEPAESRPPVAGAAVPDPAIAPAQPAPARPSESRGAPVVASTSLDALFVDQPDEEERARIARHHRDRRKSRIAGWVVFGVVLALIGGIAAGGLVVWNTYEDKIRAFMGWEEPKDYEAGIAEGEATVTIVTGDTGSTISTSLFNAGVTKTSGAFYDYLVSTRQDPTFQPGVYTLQQKMTSAAALLALQDPSARRENTAQLPEGLTMDQTLQRLSDGSGIPLADLQAAAADPSAYGVSAQSLEGWLFPATYTFDPGTTADQVIKTLVDRTVQSLDAAGVPADQRQTILTIASIIQREARFTGDFFKVSRVIQNRLDPNNEETHGKLQMDSTAQYGYGEIHKGTASSSAEALADDNPWNTYVHTGLPVGPIANPGDLAIDAAMHPADGPWLYFVTVNLDTGETVFSSTYAEHEKAVEQWQQWCAANDSDDC